MKDTFTNCARGLTVAVIGDIMLDVYVDGTVERLSPEAPNCVVLDETSRHYALGGAANVAHNLASWGVNTRLCGVIGGTTNDVYRMRLHDALHQLVHSCSLSVHDINNDDRPCTVKKRYRSSGQQLLRVDKESRLPVKVDDVAGAAIFEALDDVDAVILSDYGKGMLSDRMLAAVFAAVRDLNDDKWDGDPAGLNVPVFVDPKRTSLSAYAAEGSFSQPAVICPNIKEWKASDEYRNKDASILGRLAHMIVTDGAKGCFEAGWDEDLLCWSQQYHTHAAPTHVCDPAGAGDTFIAALAVAMMNTEYEKLVAKDIGEALDVANKIASLTVSEHGIVVPELDDVAEALEQIRMVTA